MSVVAGAMGASEVIGSVVAGTAASVEDVVGTEEVASAVAVSVGAAVVVSVETGSVDVVVADVVVALGTVESVVPGEVVLVEVSAST